LQWIVDAASNYPSAAAGVAAASAALAEDSMLPELALSLAPATSAGATARAAVRDGFGDALDRDDMADLQLVVSELVTNAFVHGRGTIQLNLRHSARELTGSVSDDGNGFRYMLRGFGGDDPHGRGLALVDALVARWGIRGGSTHVWFAMQVDAVRRPRR
jgi:two-component sensor histidine kinase